VASGMTTFLPLVVVMVYLVLSFTSIKKLDLGEYSDEQKEVLFGPWSEIIGIGKENVIPIATKMVFWVPENKISLEVFFNFTESFFKKNIFSLLNIAYTVLVCFFIHFGLKAGNTIGV